MGKHWHIEPGRRNGRPGALHRLHFLLGKPYQGSVMIFRDHVDTGPFVDTFEKPHIDDNLVSHALASALSILCCNTSSL